MKRLPSLFLQHAAFAAHAFGHEHAPDARRPNHAGGMKLDEFHVQQFRAGVIRERNAVAGAFPGIGRDFIRAAQTAGGKHHGLCLENPETAALAVVTERADDAVAVLEQRHDGVFHVDRDALMNAVVLQRANQFQPGAVADVRQPRILVAAEIALRESCRPCVRSNTAPQASSS